MPGTKSNYRIVVRAGGDDQDTNGPAFEFKPMDLLELACLIPSYAQALGFFWIDTNVAPGDVFDYIVIADHENRFSHQAANALAWLNGTPDFSSDALDGYVVTGVKHIGTPVLPPPSQTELFSLPCGGARISIAHPDRADSDAGISVVGDASDLDKRQPGSASARDDEPVAAAAGHGRNEPFAGREFGRLPGIGNDGAVEPRSQSGFEAAGRVAVKSPKPHPFRRFRFRWNRPRCRLV